MSFILTAALNTLLPNSNPMFTADIQRDTPLESRIILTNNGSLPITSLDHNFADLGMIKLIPAQTTCTSISLMNPLASGQSCTYVLHLLSNNIPGVYHNTASINATSNSGDAYHLQFAIDVNTYLYAGTANSVQKWNGTTWSTVGNGTSPGAVKTLAWDDQGHLYAGTNYDVQSLNGDTWNKVGSNPPVSVNGLTFDDQGNLFAGSATRGAQELAKGANIWQPLGIKGPTAITSLFFVNGNHTLYAGTNDYTKQWNGKAWSSTPGEPLLGSVAFALDSKNNTLYTGTDSGTVYQLNLNSNTTWKNTGNPGEEFDLVDALAFDNNDQLFAGIDNTDNSIKAHTANADWTNYGSDIPSFITALAFDGNNTLYAGNYGSGTNVYELKTASGLWEAIPGAPKNTFVNALTIGSDLSIQAVTQ
jgi:hypothetical protein